MGSLVNPLISAQYIYIYIWAICMGNLSSFPWFLVGKSLFDTCFWMLTKSKCIKKHIYIILGPGLYLIYHIQVCNNIFSPKYDWNSSHRTQHQRFVVSGLGLQQSQGTSCHGTECRATTPRVGDTRHVVGGMMVRCEVDDEVANGSFCFFFFGGGRGDSLAGFLMLFFWGVGV